MSSKSNNKLTLCNRLITTLSVETRLAEEAEKEQEHNDVNGNNTLEMFQSVWNRVVGRGAGDNYERNNDSTDTNEIVDDETNVDDMKHLISSIEDQEIKPGSLTKVAESLWKCIEKCEEEVLEVMLNSYQALRLFGNSFVKEIIKIADETCDTTNEAIKAVEEAVHSSKIFDEGDFQVDHNTKKSLCHKLGTRFVTAYFNTVFSDYLKSKVTEVNMHDTSSMDKFSHRQKVDIEQMGKELTKNHNPNPNQNQNQNQNDGTSNTSNNNGENNDESEEN